MISNRLSTTPASSALATRAACTSTLASSNADAIEASSPGRSGPRVTHTVCHGRRVVVERHLDVDRCRGRLPATERPLHTSRERRGGSDVHALRDDERVQDATVGPRDERRGDDVRVGAGERPGQAGEHPARSRQDTSMRQRSRFGVGTDGDRTSPCLGSGSTSRACRASSTGSCASRNVGGAASSLERARSSLGSKLASAARAAGLGGRGRPRRAAPGATRASTISPCSSSMALRRQSSSASRAVANRWAVVSDRASTRGARRAGGRVTR